MEKVLIVGRGGREHSLAHKALQSGRLKVFIAPGNGGMLPPLIRVPIQEHEISALRDFIRQEKINYVIIGPELPIAKGIYDDLCDLTTVIAPPQKLSFLEASKAKAKQFLELAGIPTAPAMIFTRDQQAEMESYLRAATYPLVLKASGLAGGKGVFIATSSQEALEFARGCLQGQKYGTAGQTIVVETFLEGEERSVFLLADGKSYTLLPVARDYKRLLDGDKGPNTGGMGGYAPAEDLSWIEVVREKVIEPTFAALLRMGLSYHGFLYLGLMKVQGEPYVLEYNVRLGDPEAQLILPLIANSFDEILYYYRIQKLGNLKIRVHPGYAVGVVAATKGYPEAPQKGHAIYFPPLEEGGSRLGEKTLIYWAGVEKGESNYLLTTGGRSYTLVGLGQTLEEARKQAYAGMELLPFEGRYYRKDIAQLNTCYS
ncbi:MAG: phosphoribosylamine--glycine ligase [Bacteroidia bacterium]|nr:phosphoribosylamine--glycine ligase [Bacteroidia bacterium]MDW8134563.1 phosphoribosylamine--glycine ligase [Bacteroidia bacterium]